MGNYLPSNGMNKFLSEKMKTALSYAQTNKYKIIITNEFFKLNSFGVDNEKKLLKYHYLSQHIPTLVKRVMSVYDNDISNKIIKFAISNLKDSFNETDINNIVATAFTKSNIIKIAYPNMTEDIEPLKKYDLNKWISALNDIYIKTKLFGNKSEIINQITGQWSDMQEKLDFGKWLKFYDDGGARLYKTAENGVPILPMQAITGLTPKNNDRFVDINNETQPKEKKIRVIKEKTVEELKKNIIARINSVEKLLLDYPDKMPDNQYSRLLNVLLDLKKDVFNVRTASTLADVINRTKYCLQKKGANKDTLYLFSKIAQMPTEAPQTPQAPAPDPTAGAKAIEGFVDALSKIDSRVKKIKLDVKPPTPQANPAPATPTPNTPATTTAPTSTTAPMAPTAATTAKASYNWANINTKELKLFENVANSLSHIMKQAKYLYKTAQTVPQNALQPSNELGAPATPITPNQSDSANITADPVSKDIPEANTDIIPDEEKIKVVDSPSDAKLLNLETDVLEASLKNIKLSDVITRLQALSRVFKNREISRQLAIIDIMLDKLGISGFFPALAEATRSALESNQYCQTRIEEVLSKLISATDEKGVSLLGPSVGDSSSIVDKEMRSYLDEKPKA